jgi:hypothetical protein
VLIKISNFKSKGAKRPRELRRLFKYLSSPQNKAQLGHPRLLGPPELNHLVLTHRPWGEELDLAADDLTNQLDAYTRQAGACQRECAGRPGCKGLKACVGRKRPSSWFVHIIFSFEPIAAHDLWSPADTHKTPPRNAAPAANAIRITRDALDFMGWSNTQPAVFVAHADKAHIHVHVVTTVPVFGGGLWDVFRFSRKRMFEIAEISSEAFGLPLQTDSRTPNNDD